MNAVKSLVERFRVRSRTRRRELFRQSFALSSGTKILDLGSENGSHIAFVLQGSPVEKQNVYIADISETAVHQGAERYGFRPVVIDANIRLPFPDSFFDIVYCSSVIEHVTVPKEAVWSTASSVQFTQMAQRRQREFAQEIMRVGKRFFVQTPNKHFPVESHSWLPFVAYLPRRVLVPFLRFANAVWIKKTSPDWRLLTEADMRSLFADASIIHERSLGLVKSLIAVKTN